MKKIILFVMISMLLVVPLGCSKDIYMVNTPFAKTMDMGNANGALLLGTALVLVIGGTIWAISQIDIDEQPEVENPKPQIGGVTHHRKETPVGGPR